MEFKKKTIIWEDNSEPPKDYIWIKPDNKAYEFDYASRQWKESKNINTSNESSDEGSGSGEGGGEGISGEAKELYDFIFGQTPYVLAMESESSFKIYTLYELLLNMNSFEENSLGVVPTLIYKQKTPIPKAVQVSSTTVDSTFELEFTLGNLYMHEIPEEMGLPDGPWYAAESYDVSLLDITMPSIGSSVVLTGIDIPEGRDSIRVLQEMPGFGASSVRYNYEEGKGYVYRDTCIYNISKKNGEWVLEVSTPIN